MGLSKNASFSDRQNELADIAKALSHPARIAILEYLSKHKEAYAGDLVSILPLAQPTVSQHLKEMKIAGIITDTTNGTSRIYRINEKETARLLAYLVSILSKDG